MDRKSLIVAGCCIVVPLLLALAFTAAKRLLSRERELCVILTERSENSGVLVDRCRATRIGEHTYRAVLKVQVAGLLPMIQVCEAQLATDRWTWTCK